MTTIEEARRELARAEAREAQSKKKGGSLGKILASAAVVLVVAGVAGFLATRPKDDGGGGTPVAQQPPEGTPTVGTPTVSPPPPPPPVRPAPAPVPAPGPAPGPSEPPPPEDAPAVEPPVDPRIAPEEPAVVPEEPAVTQPPPRESVPAEPVPAEPAPAEPVSVPPEEPAPVPPSVSPRELALAKTQVGAWTEARDAWAATLQADARDVLALRGTAMTWMRAADALARKGDIASALASFDGLIAYLTKIYETVYRPAAGEAKDALRVPMGFALTHRGEARTERARWLRVQGNTAAEQQAMTQAEADLRLAVQFLDHDGESFWDFLLRRSEFRRLRGDAKQYIQDVAATTAVNSELVPARMWVAHFVGLRRQAEHALLPKQGGNRPRRGGARADAAASRMAEEALQVAKRGVQWTRVRGEPFTRIQWLEAGRVLVVKEMTLEPAEDRTALHGLLKWYLEQARVQPAPPGRADSWRRRG